MSEKIVKIEIDLTSRGQREFYIKFVLVFMGIMLMPVIGPLLGGTENQINSWDTLVFSLKNDGAFFAGIFVCFSLLAIFSSVGFFRNLKSARIIRDTPTSSIRSAPQGYVEISGKSRKIDDIIAPLSKAPCIWYRYEIERRTRRKGISHWIPIDKGVSNASFIVDDGTGECAIRPDGADVRLSGNKRFWYGRTSDPSANDNTGSGTVTKIVMSFIPKNYRFTEEIINEGDALYVLGEFGTTNNATSDLQAKNDSESHLGCSHSMSIPQDGKPYIISNMSQDDLIKSLGRFNWILVPGFSVCGSIVVLASYIRYGL